MKIAPILFRSLWAVLVCGCASTSRFEEAESKYDAGDYLGAAEVVTADGESSGELLDNLYAGSAHFMAGNFDASFADFERAEAGFVDQDNSMVILFDYKGTGYDLIMANTYQALSKLAQGDTDTARIWFNRLAVAQSTASARAQKEIDKLKSETANAKNDPTNQAALPFLKAAMENQENQHKLDDFQREADNWGGYEGYENPAAHFFSGVYRLFWADDASDREKAVDAFKRAYGMARTKSPKSMLKTSNLYADGALAPDALDHLLIVAFENGMCPKREEQVIDLIIPWKGNPVYAGVAFPKLVSRDVAYPWLCLADGISGASLGTTYPLASFDNIVATEYKRKLPMLIAKETTKVIIRVALQAVAIEAAKKKYGDNAAFLVGALGSGLAKLSTHTDVRAWNLLPKEYQSKVLRKPASGKLVLSAGDSGLPFASVDIPEKGPVMVYVKIPAPGLPALVTVIGPKVPAVGND